MPGWIVQVYEALAPAAVTSMSTGVFSVPQWLVQQMATTAAMEIVPLKPPSRPFWAGLAGSEQGAPACGSQFQGEINNSGNPAPLSE